jgi:hypothetical protein
MNEKEGLRHEQEKTKLYILATHEERMDVFAYYQQTEVHREKAFGGMFRGRACRRKELEGGFQAVAHPLQQGAP